MKHSNIFPFLVLNVVNLLFYISFYWKWRSSCHVFVKWLVGQKQLDHAAIDHKANLSYAALKTK